MGILPGYTGTMVHDCWSPYFKLEEASHALCGAHIARELVYAHEQLGQTWAEKLKNLLLRILDEINQRSKLGDNCFPAARSSKRSPVVSERNKVQKNMLKP